MAGELLGLEFTNVFLKSLLRGRFSAGEQNAILEALGLLSESDRHPSLRIHELQGTRAGTWSASASRSLRIMFYRLPDGRKRVIGVSRHYED